MWRSLSFMLYVGSISALDFPQIGFCFVLAPKGSAEVSIGGVVVCRAGGGLLINRLMLPVVTRVSSITQSMFSAWRAHVEECTFNVLSVRPVCAHVRLRMFAGVRT